MRVRLELFDYLKRHPAVQATDLKNPIFVVGFTRTGTTFLHEMLGLHEGVRMHHTWEQMDPIPRTHDESAGAQTRDREGRYNANKGSFNIMFNYIVGKQIQDIHRIGYDEPEECTTPCAIELPWAVPELPLNTFAIDELAPLGAGDTFAHYRKFLQLLTWQSPDRRGQEFTWMLKCPFHLPYLQELHDEFPGATVVWTHRDPADCIASGEIPMCVYQYPVSTLMCMGMEEYSVNPALLGKAVLHYTHVNLAMAQKTIEKLGKKFKILHIKYAETIKTPQETCRKVFDKAGLPFSPEYQVHLSAYLKSNADARAELKAKKSANTAHTYHPEDYGLTAKQIREEFKDYIDKYC
ncbi:P-loop containing nucleoside triphosphate hydrolase protein [Ochromonadaceae sp. CCMP2298]|nr:P-loop containing nucleoside triphosphate hydrolase protein [Ochromonadaceae sp. CCMP2298]